MNIVQTIPWYFAADGLNLDSKNNILRYGEFTKKYFNLSQVRIFDVFSSLPEHFYDCREEFKVIRKMSDFLDNIIFGSRTFTHPKELRRKLYKKVRLFFPKFKLDYY